MPDMITVHRLVLGGKGDRKVIDAKKRFDPADYDMDEKEVRRLRSEGAIRTPDDPAYAIPNVGEGQQTATANRSPRTDLENDEDAALRRRVMGAGADEAAAAAAEPAAGTGAQAAPAGRRGRRPADEDDDDKL